MKKNDIIELSITDMTDKGAGIGRYEGQAVFVPDTAPGDRVLTKVIKVTRSYAVGRMESLIAAAACRIQPDCSVSKLCGGCAYRHISYEAECEIKKKRVNDCLQRIGGIACQVQELIPSPVINRYRNKAQFPVGQMADGTPVLGFYAPHSHRIIPVQQCYLQPEAFDRICEAFLDYMKAEHVSVYDADSGKGLVRHLYMRTGFATGQIMVCVVIAGEMLPNPKALTERLRAACPELACVLVNRNDKPTNVILGKETSCLYGQPFIQDVLLGVPFTLSLHSFYQVNTKAAALLFQKAAEYAGVTKDDVVVDLYCGTGAVGLCAAKQAGRLIGVEVVPQAVENAKENARNAGRKACEFLCMDAAKAADVLANRGIAPTVVFLDPPRKGCDEALLTTVAQRLKPKRLVYISCDPATLARDAARLETMGYTMEKATAVDMFPRTAHVETVCLLSKDKD